MSAPQLTLRQEGRVLAQNSHWSTSPESAAIEQAGAAAGAFPLAPAAAGAGADAAILINLAPGNYTAQVAGLDGGTGVALLEVYEAP